MLRQSIDTPARLATPRKQWIRAQLIVSGVHRGLQRSLYDNLRRQLIPTHDISLVIIPTNNFTVRGRFIVQNHDTDVGVVRRAFAAFIWPRLGLLIARGSVP